MVSLSKACIWVRVRAFAVACAVRRLALLFMDEAISVCMESASSWAYQMSSARIPASSRIRSR